MGQERNLPTSFQAKLNSVYGPTSKETTPVQTQRIIAKNEILVGLSQQSEITNFALLEHAFFPDGKFKSVKFEKTLQVISEFKNNPSLDESLLEFLDLKCIHKNGGISIRRLRKLRKESLKISS